MRIKQIIENLQQFDENMIGVIPAYNWRYSEIKKIAELKIVKYYVSINPDKNVIPDLIDFDEYGEFFTDDKIENVIYIGD